jgi:N-methylhydantoinase A
MARAVRAVTVERGRDPRDFCIVAFGGNGPLFAAEMAAGLGVGTVIVPPAPGVFSAVGLLEAELEHHLVRTFLRPLGAVVLAELDASFATLEAEAQGVLGGATDDAAPTAIQLERTLDLRYAGQSYELSIALPGGDDHAARFRELTERFAREHERTYGHASLDDPIAIVNLRLTARLPRREVEGDGGTPWRMTPALGAAGRSRDAWFGTEHGLHMTPVIGRGDLDGTPRAGPLLVDEYDATTLVPPGATARLDEHGNIAIATAAAAR